MLWYKAWRETRTRLIIGVLALSWICGLIVLLQHGWRADAGEPMTYASYIWKAIYKDYVRDLFIMLAIVLGGGGLLQERAHGTAGFTLALPVSRSRHLAVRAGVGVAQLVCLALVPAVVVAACSPMVGEAYPFTQALRFSLLWAACGTVVFGASLAVSSVLAGEYASWIVSLLGILLYSAILHLTALTRFPYLDLMGIMNGARMPHFESARHLWTGPLPWLPLAGAMTIALGFVAVADHITKRRDF